MPDKQSENHVWYMLSLCAVLKVASQRWGGVILTSAARRWERCTF